MADQLHMLLLEGFLGADVDMRYMDNGTAVANFRFASTHQYTKKGDSEPTKETTWMKVVCWGKLGEIVAKYCEKGSWVIVTGRLRPSENGSPAVYETKNGGHGASFEMTADTVRILKGKDGAPKEDSHSDPDDEGDNIPF